MYLIAKGSDNILVYIYENMDEEFTLTFKFDDFKNATNFQYTYEDFIKSIKYLCGMNILKKDFPKYQKIDFDLKFTLPFDAFRYVENLISPDSQEIVV